VVKTATTSSGLNDLSMCFKQIKSRIFPAIILTLLASCSSKQSPVEVSQIKPATDIEEIVTVPTTLNAEQHIELAQTLDGKAAVEELIIASKLFFQEKNYPKALWLADKTLPLIDEETPLDINTKVQLTLIKAGSLQQLGFYAESHLQLEQLKAFSNNNGVTLSASYYRLLSAVFQDKKRPVASLSAQLYAFELTNKNSQSQLQVQQLWLNFQRLSQWQLKLLALDKAPNSKGWLQLTSTANKFGANEEQLKYHLSMWQRKFKLHPANIIAKELTTTTLTPKTIENIAIILPLTGKQRTAGLAIQQGILASFSNDETKKLHFLDSSTVNWYGLTNEFSTLNIDYVIGPLLKSNVDKYITHTSTETQSQNDYMLDATSNLFDFDASNKATDTSMTNTKQTTNYITAVDSDSAIEGYLQPTRINKAIPTLLLNIPANASLTEQHTVFSMRPEDEASQAAATLSRQDYQHPIVLSQKNIVSKRIAQAFVKQWRRITGDNIEVVYYDTGAQMQANIKASLAVDKSKIRIKKLEGRLNQNIKTQTRNRRDIDMIYLVGTPEQTRLVKPYIEVNISPFAEIIPVFASSRSHGTKSDYSTNSDLQGLTFTEIPWLLRGKQNTELATLSQKLWPKRSDGLSRLFAMGYDSYHLIDKIPLMQQAPYLQHWGQTGVLKLDENSILTRSLLWGAYKSSKVVAIAME
jgi:outer membrane PBP1 activator LpoA protein